MKKFSLALISLLVMTVLPSQVLAADLTGIQETLSNYLPYILIGGAVILLISIVGILLSKKKDARNTEEPITMAQPATPVAPVTQDVPEVTPTPMEEMATEPVSNNLYTPTPTEEVATEPVNVEPARPSIQETLESPMPTDTHSADLQAISQAEAATEPMSPVTEQSMPVVEPEVTATPVVETPTFEPISEPAVQPMVETPTLEPVSEPSPIPPIDTSTNTVPDLQQFVNNQVEQVPPVATPMETPPQMDSTMPQTPDVAGMPTPETPDDGTSQTFNTRREQLL
jgi:hypothetical protein